MSTAHITSVVLAGGFGTRIQHLLPDTPKPMASVAGRPFLEWVLRFLAEQGVTDAILSTGHKAEVIEAHFAAQSITDLRVTCRPETEPLGSAGGFLHAIADHRPAPSAWLVCNGDSVALALLEPLFASLDANQWDACILGVKMADAAAFGTLEVSPQGLLEAFHEKRPGAGLINAGIYLFRAAVPPLFPDKKFLSFETDVFPALIARGVRIGVYVADAPYIDIGTPDSLSAAEAFVKLHLARFGPLE